MKDARVDNCNPGRVHLLHYNGATDRVRNRLLEKRLHKQLPVAWRKLVAIPAKNGATVLRNHIAVRVALKAQLLHRESLNGIRAALAAEIVGEGIVADHMRAVFAQIAPLERKREDAVHLRVEKDVLSVWERIGFAFED